MECFFFLSFFAHLSLLHRASFSLPLCQPALVSSHPFPAVECHLLPMSHCALRSCSGNKGQLSHTQMTFGGNKANVLLLVYPHLHPLRDASCWGASLIYPPFTRAVQLCQRACNPFLIRHLDMNTTDSFYCSGENNLRTNESVCQCGVNYNGQFFYPCPSAEKTIIGAVKHAALYNT